MATVLTRPTGIQHVSYAKLTKSAEKEPSINGKEMLKKQEKSKERLEFIEFLTQYMEDLKAGRPVENLSPSNDPYYLIPENIAIWIKAEKSLLAGKAIRINSIKDIIGEWDTE